ncbi:MAG: PhzF family phenazine biosynthesis protein [Methanoregula sp.]|nr:PhzF family phenazine biosynthesis protein [Methanoregula sp.]
MDVISIQRYRFKKIDAFVEGDSSGNPAGCIYLPDKDALSVEGMQRIARELAGFVSEVVYVYPDEGHTGLRFFSSEREVAFCGHCTIAVMYDLIKNDKFLARDPIVRIRVKERDLLVRNEIISSDAVFISEPIPRFLSTDLNRKEIAAALKIPLGGISEKYLIMMVNASLATLIVPITSLDALLSIHPDQKNLREFCLTNGIEILLVFSEGVSIKTNNYRSRVFAPVYGYLEDPATGTGNAALGYYLLNAGIWDGHLLRIEQGKSRDHPNIIRLVSDASKIQRSVFFGGNAKVRIEGEYLLYP